MKTLTYRDDAWQAVLAETGGNLIRLRHRALGLDILRTPPSHRAFEEKPQVWGLPLLFPPNRIADGRFTWNGRAYALPVNEPARNNRLHGFLHARPWQLERLPDGLAATCRFTADALWPHPFTARVEYVFTQYIAYQHITFINTGSEPMPFLFGQHSAFRLPRPDSSIRVTLAPERFEMDARWLPTGRRLPMPQRRFDNRSGAVSCHAEILPDGKGFRGAVIEHPSLGAAVVYEVDANYRFWVLWNDGGRRRFFCTEPQTCAVNAPNAQPRLGETGLRGLAPGESLTLETSLRVVSRPAALRGRPPR